MIHLCYVCKKVIIQGTVTDYSLEDVQAFLQGRYNVEEIKCSICERQEINRRTAVVEWMKTVSQSSIYESLLDEIYEKYVKPHVDNLEELHDIPRGICSL